MAPSIDSYLHTDHLPHIWCPGCGIGTVVGSFLRAASSLGLQKENTVVVGGIGCSSRAVGYLDFSTVHAIHGRALAFATGIKMVRPEFTVIVLTGDGDGAAIGGNHLIHACRRNIDITCILFNNEIYGMTGGQLSPLMSAGGRASTAPFGHREPPFDLCALTQAAGASFVARGTAYGAAPLERVIRKGIEHRGFSFIEAVSQCPTEFGKRNVSRSAIAMLEDQKERTVSARKAARLEPEELEDKIITGIIHQDDDALEFGDEYRAMMEELEERGGDGNGGA